MWPLGWVKEHAGRDGKPVYYAVYRDLQGRERSIGSFARKGEAKAAWQDAESLLRAGKLIGDPKLGRQKFRQYVEDTWFPQHPIEATTREGYRYLLDRYVLPEFGNMRMREILPAHVRAWVLRLKEDGVGPPTISKCKRIVDAIFTTALNDQITVLHPGRGVKTPPVPQEPRKIITAEQFDRLYAELPDGVMRLLVETDIESGLRWGELTELRVKDLDRRTGVLTISRVVVHLKAKERPARSAIRGQALHEEPGAAAGQARRPPARQARSAHRRPTDYAPTTSSSRCPRPSRDDGHARPSCPTPTRSG